ncbi:MAG: DUF721 domain-containing protein [Actinomycetota bacterium]
MNRPRRVDPADRDPRPLAAALDELTGQLGMAPSSHLSAVFAHWAEVAGPVVSAHATPVGLRRGVLQLEVAEPGWATQLRHLEPQLVARLCEQLGDEAVTAVRVTVTGRSHRGRSRG